MGKHIYSLVLSDDVIAAADQLAYRTHTSRSNLINQILAEHLSCVTPEMRMQLVFAGMEALAIQEFQMLEQTSANICILQSHLDYKYKPTVAYTVILHPEKNAMGRLRVQLRTQNQILLAELEDFFRFWISLEEHYLLRNQNHQMTYQITPGRLERSIPHTDMEEQRLGKAIGEYVRRFDNYLKAWFAGHPAGQLEQKFAEEAQIIRSQQI